MSFPNPETLIQHLGEESHVLGAVVPPIFQTSLFVFEDCAAFEHAAQTQTEPGCAAIYSRVTNPTLDILEAKLAALEHCERVKVFSSGMAAISSAILSCVAAGDHVVCLDTCYGPTREFFAVYLPRFGVETTFVHGIQPDDFQQAMRPNTKLVYIESPGSIVFWIQDIEAICEIAHAGGAKVIMDNSYASPIFQTPADFGVDIVVHSATKYISGHSDVVAGALMCSAEHFEKLLLGEVSLLGSALPPFPAWLVLRGLRTLPIRMRAHEKAGNEVAEWVRNHPKIAHTNHVGFADHPQRALIEKQMRGTGGQLSFELKENSREKAIQFVNALQLFQRGVSWGGFESLVVTLPYSPINWDEPRWIIRLYCGLESVEDLIADLDQALALV